MIGQQHSYHGGGAASHLLHAAESLDVQLLRVISYSSQYCCGYPASTRSPFPRLCKQGVPREGEAGICIVEAICDACYALHPVHYYHKQNMSNLDISTNRQSKTIRSYKFISTKFFNMLSL